MSDEENRTPSRRTPPATPGEHRRTYDEALGELSDHGESPERLRQEPLDEEPRAAYPEGSYGEENWEWEGVQRGPSSRKGPEDDSKAPQGHHNRPRTAGTKATPTPP
jgi:hypothetical protein